MLEATLALKPRSLELRCRPTVGRWWLVRITDSKEQPLELSDLDADSIRFTIAAIKTDKSGETSYHNYILTRVTGKEYVYKGETRKPVLAETMQPDFDNGGTLARLRPGVFTYTFKTALPANYDRNATHVRRRRAHPGKRKVRRQSTV